MKTQINKLTGGKAGFEAALNDALDSGRKILCYRHGKGWFTDRMENNREYKDLDPRAELGMVDGVCCLKVYNPSYFNSKSYASYRESILAVLNN